MSNKIILKKSSVTSKAPTVGDLEYGELAINYADKRLYFRDSTNAISYFATTSANGSQSSGSANTIQLSDGSGGFKSSSNLTYNIATSTLTVGGTSVSGNSSISASDAVEAIPADNLEIRGGNGGIYEANNQSVIGYGGNVTISGGTSYTSNKAGAIILKTNDSIRATIDTDGNYIQGTNTAAGAKHTVYGTTSNRTMLAKTNDADANSIPITAWNNSTSGNSIFAEFGTDTAYTVRGNITYNRDAGLVSYNTTSDYRVKVIVGPVVNPGDIIDNLKIYQGIMIDANIIRPMMIAHEAQEVVPYAVTGQRDAVDETGHPVLQQMDHSSLVPLLIAEIQSLRARVKQLEDRDSK